MVTVDPTGNDVIDYSDFQTQMVRAFAFYNPPPDGADQIGGIVVEYDVEPLEGIGGLANNEVAELMYLETNAIVDIAEAADAREVQTGHADLSGMVGINLTARQDFVRSSTVDGEATLVDEVNGAVLDTDAFRAPTVTDNDRLQMFEAFAGFGSGDPNGSGQGGYSYTPFQDHKNFRGTHGRGPVLDQTDKISILAESSTPGLANPDSLIEMEVRLTMYWDIAETSDAGRRFSVPSGL